MIHPADTKHDTTRSVLLCEISPAVSQERRDGGAEDENLTNTANVLRLQSNGLRQTLLWLGGLSNEPRCPDFAKSQERQQKKHKSSRWDHLEQGQNYKEIKQEKAAENCGLQGPGWEGLTKVETKKGNQRPARRKNSPQRGRQWALKQKSV